MHALINTAALDSKNAPADETIDDDDEGSTPRMTHQALDTRLEKQVAHERSSLAVGLFYGIVAVQKLSHEEDGTTLLLYSLINR